MVYCCDCQGNALCCEGEIGCAYASGCLSREQTLLVAYNRGRLPVAHGVSGGLMAATGLAAAEALARVEGSKVVLACDNSPASTTLSGILLLTIFD